MTFALLVKANAPFAGKTPLLAMYVPGLRQIVAPAAALLTVVVTSAPGEIVIPPAGHVRAACEIVETTKKVAPRARASQRFIFSPWNAVVVRAAWNNP